MWEPITLSAGQIKRANRDGGCEIVLPWPEGLARGEPVDLDEERDASRGEHRAAVEIVGPACRSAGLTHVRTVVATMRRPVVQQMPRPGAVEQHLIPLLVGPAGRERVKAREAPPPDQRWSTVERIARRGAGAAQADAAPMRLDIAVEKPAEAEITTDSPDLSSTDLGAEVRAYRERMGLTRVQLAQRWDVDTGTVRQWEAGDRKARLAGPLRRLMLLDV